MDIKEKALRVIEAITSESTLNTKQKEAIYKFSHTALGECKNPHTDWVEELDKAYNYMKKKDLI